MTFGYPNRLASTRLKITILISFNPNWNEDESEEKETRNGVMLQNRCPFSGNHKLPLTWQGEGYLSALLQFKSLNVSNK